MSSDSPPKSGRGLRIGKYEVVKHLATGGMGAVYKARDVDLNRIVALKVLPEERAKDPRLLERFRREAVRGAKLRHDNIVTLYDSGEANGFYYLAVEFVDGIDLHAYIYRRRKLSPQESHRFISQAVKALGHLHEQGVVHRDIKPANFLVMEKEGGPIIKLIDLGLAREIEGEDPRVTQAGTTVGTVDYIAPEQARDCGKADVRSDIYSLGCTWFHMLAGKAPFAEGTTTERLYKHVSTPPPDIRQFNAEVPPSMREVLDKMLAKKAADRQQTPADLLRELERALNPPEMVADNVLAQLTVGVDDSKEVPAAPPSSQRDEREERTNHEAIDDRRRPRSGPQSPYRRRHDDDDESSSPSSSLPQQLVLWGAVALALVVVAAAIVVLVMD